MKDPFGKRAEDLIRREFGDILTLLEVIPNSINPEEPLSLVEWMVK